MADHSVEIKRVGPRFIGVCSCGRWRTPPRASRADAEKEGLIHEVHGDLQLQVLAASNRGGRLESELRWYEQEAENPLNGKEEREMWARLAEELRRRVKPKGPGPDDRPLF